jgi:uncharacterized membrane protein
MGKTVKTLVVLSVVWILMMYAATSEGYGFDEVTFIVVGIIPLVVVWGIYWIRRN